ncbi:hypothetical protein BC832DRAFT_618479 [Gaertneriomyces semiglobifer]|nr:hypothetical protein BC832DRAFT_618479 [Gaertneriomyces semiglobifer]
MNPGPPQQQNASSQGQNTAGSAASTPQQQQQQQQQQALYVLLQAVQAQQQQQQLNTAAAQHNAGLSQTQQVPATRPSAQSSTATTAPAPIPTLATTRTASTTMPSQAQLPATPRLIQQYIPDVNSMTPEQRRTLLNGLTSQNSIPATSIASTPLTVPASAHTPASSVAAAQLATAMQQYALYQHTPVPAAAYTTPAGSNSLSNPYLSAAMLPLLYQSPYAMNLQQLPVPAYPGVAGIPIQPVIPATPIPPRNNNTLLGSVPTPAQAQLQSILAAGAAKQQPQQAQGQRPVAIPQIPIVNNATPSQQHLNILTTLHHLQQHHLRQQQQQQLQQQRAAVSSPSLSPSRGRGRGRGRPPKSASVAGSQLPRHLQSSHTSYPGSPTPNHHPPSVHKASLQDNQPQPQKPPPIEIPPPTPTELAHIQETQSRISKRLKLDQEKALNPDISKFRDMQDVIERLLPFHVFQYPEPQKELTEEELESAGFSSVERILERTQSVVEEVASVEARDKRMVSKHYGTIANKLVEADLRAAAKRLETTGGIDRSGGR